MSKLIALLQFLLALAGVDVGGSDYSNRISNGGHDVLNVRTHVQHGVARFECLASDSGWCHYTLYAGACDAGSGSGCTQAPLRRFSVARGDSRQIAGLDGFRVCVGLDAGTLGPDCKPPRDVATP